MKCLRFVVFATVAVIGTVLSPIAAQETEDQTAGEKLTIDFEEFAKGEIVSAVRHSGTEKMIRVHGVNPGFPHNAAVIFDSSIPGVEDRDLGSPNEDFTVPTVAGQPAPGPGRGDGGAAGLACQNDRGLGKILIVDDDLKPLTEDGRVATPDDEGRAGARLQIDFSEVGPVTIHGLAVIDVEEPDADVRFYSVGIDERKANKSRKQILAEYRVHTEDNGVARLFDPELRNVVEEGCHVTLERRRHGQPLQPVSGVKSIEVAFNGSGAIARIIYSVP